jgi:hypothetical protein
MNWTKAILAGVVGGIALNLADWIMHGFILGPTYMKYPVFTQEPASPLYFLAISLLMGIFAALLFAKTRSSWAEGIAGGATYGFFLGLIQFFAHFYNPLVFEGFPYYLSWCWGGVGMIGMVILGAVLGLIYKRA